MSYVRSYASFNQRQLLIQLNTNDFIGMGLLLFFFHEKIIGKWWQDDFNVK